VYGVSLSPVLPDLLVPFMRERNYRTQRLALVHEVKRLVHLRKHPLSPPRNHHSDATCVWGMVTVRNSSTNGGCCLMYASTYLVQCEPAAAWQSTASAAQ